MLVLRPPTIAVRTLPALSCLGLAIIIGGCARGARPAENAPSGRMTIGPPATAPLPAPPVATRAVALEAVEIGRSVEGRPLTMYVFGRPGDGTIGVPAADGPTFILGGIHGNEPTSAAVCRELVDFLRTHPDAWAGRRVCVLPEANPDGLTRRLRANKNLVDLNRNFPAANWKKRPHGWTYGGDAPGSQPETCALIETIERLRPVRIVSVHSMDQPCNNYDGPAEALARRMAAVNGYPVRASIGYPTPGSLGSWAGVDRRMPVVTLELPAAAPAARSWAANRDALLAVVNDPAVASAGELVPPVFRPDRP